MPPMSKSRKVKRRLQRQWKARNIPDPGDINGPGNRAGSKIGDRIRTFVSRILNPIPVRGQFRPIFSSESLGINANPTYLFNGFKALNGASLELFQGQSSFAVAAANVWRIESFSVLSTTVANAFTSNDTMPWYKYQNFYMEMDSDNYFMAIPFLVLLENGESISSVNANTNNVDTAVKTALPAQTRNLIYGPVVKSTRFRDNGADRFRAKMGVSLAQFMNFYARHYRESLLKEQNALVLALGLAIAGVATKTVSIDYTVVTGWYQRDPDIRQEA